MKEEPLFAFAQIFESDVEDLTHEVYQTRWLLQGRETRVVDGPFTRLCFLNLIKRSATSYLDFVRFVRCKISVVIPVSTAFCERLFSALKLIKNHLRTTMVDARISHPGSLSIESRGHITSIWMTW